MKLKPYQPEKPIFEKLEEVDVSTLSPEERAKYEQSVKVYRDYLLTMNSAKQIGFAEGYAKSYIEYCSKYCADKTLEEMNIDIAKYLKSKEIYILFIAEVTGLTEKEIKQL